MESIKKKRGRPMKPVKEKVKRVFKQKCQMCRDLNKNRLLNKDKIATIINLKPVVVSLMN